MSLERDKNNCGKGSKSEKNICPLCNEKIGESEKVIIVEYPMKTSKLSDDVAAEFEFSGGGENYSSCLIHVGCVSRAQEKDVEFIFNRIALEVFEDLGESLSNNLIVNDQTLPIQSRYSRVGESCNVGSSFNFACPECGGKFDEITKYRDGMAVCPLCDQIFGGGDTV